MIKIYTTPSCSSCRKVKKWFMDENIPFIEKNILIIPLKDSELKDILTKSENGTDDIIATKSKIIKEKNVDINSMSLNELIQFIQENPTVLKRPIIVDDHRIQVGYNPEEITTFIPFARHMADLACSHDNCPKYSTCDHVQGNNEII